ncbi:MAG: VOC family protein [Spirochaetes bacterium]|nr:VOC family protein [Spirochaetota bacterium]
MIQRIDHISIAVRDYEKARQFFQDILGAIPGAGAQDDTLNFFWKIFSLGDLSRIELITPTSKGSFLEGFLKNRNGGVHHITIQVSNIKAAQDKLNEVGIPFFGYHEYSGGVWKEIFIHPKDAFGVLIQLAEFNADDWLAHELRFHGTEKYCISSTNDSIMISFPHPGGGTFSVTLSKSDARKLCDDINARISR